MNGSRPNPKPQTLIFPPEVLDSQRYLLSTGGEISAEVQEVARLRLGSSVQGLRDIGFRRRTILEPKLRRTAAQLCSSKYPVVALPPPPPPAPSLRGK